MVTSLSKTIERFLQIYPFPIQRLFRKSVIVSSETRFRNGNRIEGSYDLETGEVILWNPNITDQEGLFVVLTHEWGHKFYNEWISTQDRGRWLQIRSEERIDFSLDRFYPTIKLPEEEFCTIFCLVSKELYLEKIGMSQQAKKILGRLKEEFPKATALVLRQLNRSSKKTASKLRPLHDREITHREVEVIKSWIHKTIDE